MIIFGEFIMDVSIIIKTIDDAKLIKLFKSTKVFFNFVKKVQHFGIR